MKLDDWIIQDAIKSGYWLTAVNAVCDRLGLPNYLANSPEILSLVITDKVYPIVPVQIRIICGVKAYTWMAGGRIVSQIWPDSRSTKIRIWTDNHETK